MSMNMWREVNKRYRAEWTGRGQGVATDGVSWFVTQNDSRPGVSRYSADFSTLEVRAEIPRSVAGHVGAVSIVDGIVSIALESPQALITYNRDLDQKSFVPIDRPVERDDMAHLAWCSVNPANGLLYTCDWNFADTLSAYEPSSGMPRTDQNITLSEPVHRVQGGAFTETGQVYLASDDLLNIPEWIRKVFRVGGKPRKIFPGIHCFDTATGQKTDYRRVPVRPWPPFFEEIEGIGVGEMVIDGIETHVHLSFLDKNHSWVRDDVVIKSYAVPEPDKL